MTWTVENGEIIAPWGDKIGEVSGTYSQTEVQQMVVDEFRSESMSEMTTERLADYAAAWMGDIEL